MVLRAQKSRRGFRSGGCRAGNPQAPSNVQYPPSHRDDARSTFVVASSDYLQSSWKELMYLVLISSLGIVTLSLRYDILVVWQRSEPLWCDTLVVTKDAIDTVLVGARRCPAWTTTQHSFALLSIRLRRPPNRTSKRTSVCRCLLSQSRGD